MIDVHQLVADSALRRRSRRIQARILARGRRAVALSGEAGIVLCGPDPSKPGRYRWTVIDDRGPVGHREAASLELAVLGALEDGFAASTGVR